MKTLQAHRIKAKDFADWLCLRDSEEVVSVQFMAYLMRGLLENPDKKLTIIR